MLLYPNNPKPALQYKFYASELLDKKENKCTKGKRMDCVPYIGQS